MLTAILLVEPGLAGFIESEDDGIGGDNWSYKSCKARVKSSPSTNQHRFFTGRTPFLSPNQECQSTLGKTITFQGLAHPKLIWGFSNFVFDHWRLLVTLGRVAMPLISPLMPDITEQNRASYDMCLFSFFTIPGQNLSTLSLPIYRDRESHVCQVSLPNIRHS